MVRLAAQYSKIERIIPDRPSVLPPQTIFGEEPEHTWCYYYQKASLARQLQDWDEVVRLGDIASQEGLKPFDRSEQIPFLEGYILADRFDKAQEIIADILKLEILTKETCDYYLANPDYPSPSTNEYLFQNLCGVK
ncbi:MAG: hypothetical protein HC806_04415 [Anaerolineae bacterium]|nr:hypothetical protein [Anaerolineae bacterium]